MKRRRVAILGTLTAFAVGGCGAPPTTNPQVTVPVQQPPITQPQANASPMANPGKQDKTIEVETLAKGTKSDMRQPGYQVLRSAGELVSFIKQAGIKESVPDVNWNDEMAIAVFGGERPGTIEVVSVVDSGNEMQVKVAHKGETGASAETNHSYHLIVVPKSTSEVSVKGLPEGVAAMSAASPAPSANPGQGNGQGQDQNVVSLVARGPNSGVKQPVNVVIRTAEELKAVWDTHKQGLTQGTEMPDIDFSARTVIGIFIGQSQQAATIELETVTPTQAAIVVKGRMGQATAASAGGAPFIMIAVPKTNMPVDIQIQGAPQAQTLGNPQQQPQAQQPTMGQNPGAGGGGMTRPGFGMPVAGSQGMTPSLGGAYAQPPFPSRGSLVTGGGSGGLLGAGGYVPGR